MKPPPPPIIPLPPTNAPVLAARGKDKIWSAICHLSVFLVFGILLVPLIVLVPLVVYLAIKDKSAYLAANAKEALNFHISVIIYGFWCVVLRIILSRVGNSFLITLYLTTYILAIVATIKALVGGCYRYPLTLRLIQ
jgi:uncharacterized Tic20 family protein